MNTKNLMAASAVTLLLAGQAFANQGSALITVGEQEHLIPIECKDANNVAQGFNTEPARVTSTWTNRRSTTRFNLRPWKETEYMIASLDRYVAWIPKTGIQGPTVDLVLDMSPATSMASGLPRALTFDRWMAGEREAGLTGVKVAANCQTRDEAAPRYRKIQNP